MEWVEFFVFNYVFDWRLQKLQKVLITRFVKLHVHFTDLILCSNQLYFERSMQLFSHFKGQLTDLFWTFFELPAFKWLELTFQSEFNKVFKC